MYIKIGDFGISKQLRAKQGISENKAGTKEYMAPEIMIN